MMKLGAQHCTSVGCDAFRPAGFKQSPFGCNGSSRGGRGDGGKGGAPRAQGLVASHVGCRGEWQCVECNRRGIVGLLRREGQELALQKAYHLSAWLNSWCEGG